ncbi:MAG: hypothetical protein RL097_567 [Candidatus Parcubacteria bacterium]|jgi:hypothetical protein
MKIKKSIRRIGNALIAVGVLSLSLVTLSQLTFQCSTDKVGCLAAAVTFSASQENIPEAYITDGTAVTTVSEADNVPSVASFFIEVVRVTSVYLILLGVVALIMLELKELHYLRKLTHKVRRA